LGTLIFHVVVESVLTEEEVCVCMYIETGYETNSKWMDMGDGWG